MAWNREHAHLGAKQESMLGQMFGHMTITYASGGKGSVAMEPYALALGTNTHAMHGFTNSADFGIIRRKEDRVVVRTTSGLMSNDVSTIHFEGRDTYWVLLNDDEAATSAREYFRRLTGPCNETQSAR